MSDVFYTIVRTLGRPIFWVSSSPTVLHADRVRAIRGPLILVPNHLSPFDIPCLMASTRRRLDFLAAAEFFRSPAVGRFFRRMNAFPVDRGQVDAAATRVILNRLDRGRTVAMFPEGRLRTPAASLLNGGKFNASVTRIAQLAGAPIVPCVVLGTGAYARASAWLPLRRIRYAVNFGEPIAVPAGEEADAILRLRRAYDDLYDELRGASGLTAESDPWSTAERDERESVR
jgi:1-acyl-sn-glycerol-3-phosphate acyltransferase